MIKDFQKLKLGEWYGFRGERYEKHGEWYFSGLILGLCQGELEVKLR